MDSDAYYNKKITDPDIAAFIATRPPLPDSPKRIHIVGVCGTAMGQLAGLLKGRGFMVSGSDQQCYPPVSTMVEGLEIDLHIGNFQKENISGTDLVVVGNVVRSHNPETKFARDEKIPQASLPEALRQYVFPDAKRLVVAGTHGKTTTTGLLAHIFEVAGKDPGYMIGGVPQQKSEGYALGSGAYAIFEGDEYDTAYFDKRPKFLHYGAHSAIITSLELDHMDIYASFEAYEQAFIYFAETLPADGHLFVNDAYAGLRDVAAKSAAHVYTYGDAPSSDAHHEHLRQEGVEQVFDFIFKGEKIGELRTPLSGAHNAANIVGAVALAYAEGLAFTDIQKAVASFTGMRRRQEIIAEIPAKDSASAEGTVIIMDDFAHHPTAVKTTVAGVHVKYPSRRLVAIFEPSTRSSRKKIFEQNYIEAFDGADFVCFKMPKFGQGEDPADVLDAAHVVSEISKRGPQARAYDDIAALIGDIAPALRAGDIVLIMSHGEFDKVRTKLMDRLKTV